MKRGSTIYQLDVAGHHSRIRLRQRDIERTHRPIFDRIASTPGISTKRSIVLIAGPPGSGKSTLANLWVNLGRDRHPLVPLQTLPMDGFHFPNRILETRDTMRDGISVPLSLVKGAPESFDLERLIASVKLLREGAELRWPYYDRRVHEPLEEAISVIDRGAVLLEGNYLMLDGEGWRELSRFADLRIFVECSERRSRRDVVRRAVRGGKSPKEAAQHFDFSDRHNYSMVMGQRLPSDIVLRRIGNRVRQRKSED